MYALLVFFFKQKTAYEMRISDWSSDVCSSDLHVEVTRGAANVVRIHNYPSQWVAYHDSNALGTSDPVHRASHMSCAGFLWSEMKMMIPLNSEDRRVLALSREYGVGDGFTVPANVPGEPSGS